MPVVRLPTPAHRDVGQVYGGCREGHQELAEQGINEVDLLSQDDPELAEAVGKLGMKRLRRMSGEVIKSLHTDDSLKLLSEFVKQLFSVTVDFVADPDP